MSGLGKRMQTNVRFTDDGHNRDTGRVKVVAGYVDQIESVCFNCRTDELAQL
jgi:hypothetical protein